MYIIRILSYIYKERELTTHLLTLNIFFIRSISIAAASILNQLTLYISMDVTYVVLIHTCITKKQKSRGKWIGRVKGDLKEEWEKKKKEGKEGREPRGGERGIFCQD